MTDHVVHLVTDDSPALCGTPLHGGMVYTRQIERVDCHGCLDMLVGDFHVVPVNDLIEHITIDTDCPCGPTTQPVFRDDGSTRWLYVHHSLDGRELNE